jgi:hypothetical protein
MKASLILRLKKLQTNVSPRRAMCERRVNGSVALQTNRPGQPSLDASILTITLQPEFQDGSIPGRPAIPSTIDNRKVTHHA